MTSPDVPTGSATLPAGGRMPLLGFGTWQLSADQAEQATAAALRTGYRHLDTATMYRNERQVGAALLAADVARDQVFVTTKLPPDRAGQARRTLEQSLEQLGLDALDLWLVHWPPDSGTAALWREFVAARDEGLVRDIGVSNFSLQQLDEVTDTTGVAPAVNQIRWSPLLYDAHVLDGHHERGVVLEGYSGLKGGTLDEPTISGIADRLGRTAAQVIVRWHLQHEIVVIPKSAHAERIVENADVGGFTLSERDMAALDALGSG